MTCCLIAVGLLRKQHIVVGAYGRADHETEEGKKGLGPLLPVGSSLALPAEVLAPLEVAPPRGAR